MAGLLWVLAGLALGHQFQCPQRQGGRAGFDQRQRIQRQPPPGSLGRQKKHLVEPLPRCRLEQRKHRAHGFANAGGRLRQQAAATAARTIDCLGQIALPRAEGWVGKGQPCQGRITLRTMRQFLRGPVQKLFALRFKIMLQGLGAELLAQQRFLQAVNVQINQRQAQLGQAQFLAQQPAVNLHLRPVQLPVVVRQGGQVAAKGFDLFKLQLVRIVAIGSAAHHQLLVFAAQAELGLVAVRAARRNQRVARHAFLRGRRRRKAQVQVAVLGGEFAQGPDSHKIFQASPLPRKINISWRFPQFMPSPQGIASWRGS